MSTLHLGRRSDHRASPRTEREEFLFEVGELLLLVARRGAWIAACAALCAAGAIVAVEVREPVYTSTARLMLDPRGLNVVDDQVVPQSPSSDVNDAVIDTEIRLISSDEVLRAAVEACGLQHDPAFIGRPGLLARTAMRLGLRAAPPEPADPIGVAAGTLSRQLTVQRDGKSFVVDVTARADAPDKAVRIAKATVAGFLADLVTQRRDLVTRAQSAMEATLGGQRDRVARAEIAVERYKGEAGIVDADGRTLNLASITQLDSQILAAHTAAATLSARLAQLDAMRRRPDKAQDVDSPLLTQLRTSRTEIARQQANLQASLGPRHPQIQEIGAQLKSLDRAIVAEIDRLTATVRADYLGAAGRERSLVADRGRLKGKIAGANTALVGMRQLEREAEAQRGVYQKFLGRERELREQETISPVNATLIAEPTPSETATGPKPGLLVGAGLMLGLLLGTALAWASERWSGRVYSAGRLGARTGLPVLGVMPLALPGFDGGATVGCALAGGRGTASSRVIQRLADTLDRGGGPSSLLILSASDHGAASIVASGVVLAAAALGHRALLVEVAARDDPDRLAPRFKIRPGGTAACKVEGFPAFDIARLGPAASPAALAGWNASWLSGHDRIVLDAGRDAENATVRRLAAAASAIVIVVEAEFSTFSDVEALRDLIDAEDRILGLLLAVQGADPVRLLPARAFARPASPELPRALRSFIG